ncbi:MAG: hypothetical protein HRF50_16880 [Phycisphaerae bacterium]|jgi:hypothetical protein
MSRLRDHAALLVALGSVVGWYAALAVVNPVRIADERIHFGLVEEILQGEALSTNLIPMLPAYHYAIAGATWLLGGSLNAARAVNAAVALVGVLLLHACTAGRPAGQRGMQALLYAWNPILLPLCAMVYTEGAATVAIVGAVLAALRGRHGWAALALAVACVVRQSNILWAAFFVGWRMLDGAGVGEGGRLRDLLTLDVRSAAQAARSAWPYGLVVAGAAVFFAIIGGVTVGPAHDNRPRFNPAQFYLFASVVVVLWAPLLARELVRHWPAILVRLRWGGICAGFIAAAGTLEMLYVNPHPWNGDPAYLRNRLLVALHTSLPLRAGAATVFAAAGPLLLWVTRAQPQRALLALVWASGALFLLPHWLAEMRYYIVPIALLHLFANYRTRIGWTLVAWQGALSAAICTFIALYGTPHGGLW